MADILFSIVIPAYNAEPYLRKCVDSCLNQKGDVPNYEIIIVNDGSTDGTQGIIEEYEAGLPFTVYGLQSDENEGIHNPKVSFIRQPNGGLSKARNEGLKKAQGEYVWFVDSDDWITENALSVLAGIVIEHHPDVITFKGYDSKGEDLTERKNPYSNNKGTTGLVILRMMGTTMWNPCAQYYCMKKRFLEKYALRFMDRVIHEDSEFTPRMLYYAKSAYITTDFLYYSYHNPVSLNRKKNPEKAFHTLRVIDSLCSFSHDIPQKKDRKIFNDIIATTMNSAMKETKDMDNERVVVFRNKIKKDAVTCMWQSSKLKFKVEGLLLMLCPSLLITYVRNRQQ